MGRSFCAIVLLLLGTSAWSDPLRLGFGSGKPPYVFDVSGKPDPASANGLEFDIVAAAAKAAGFDVDPYLAPQSRVVHMMQNGQLDAIADTREEPGTPYFYSAPCVQYHDYAVALASRGLEINSIADLSRYSVVSFQTARSVLGPDFAAMAEKNSRYYEEPVAYLRNVMLYAGATDVLVGDKRIFEYANDLASSRVDVNRRLHWYPIFPQTSDTRIAFIKADQRDRFDKGLQAIRQSGLYATIEKRYDAP